MNPTGQRQNRTFTLTAPMHKHTVSQSRAGRHQGRSDTSKSLDNRALTRRYARMQNFRLPPVEACRTGLSGAPRLSAHGLRFTDGGAVKYAYLE